MLLLTENKSMKIINFYACSETDRVIAGTRLELRKKEQSHFAYEVLMVEPDGETYWNKLHHDYFDALKDFNEQRFVRKSIKNIQATTQDLGQLRATI